MQPKHFAIAFAIVAGLSVATSFVWNRDHFRWPVSAQERIDVMSAFLRKKQGPVSWCEAADSVASNRWAEFERTSPILADCFSRITPTSDFIEEAPREYMKRFYGATTAEYVCEVTLSTVWNEDRFVGSDCYYGIFKKDEFPGVGATDEPFG